MTMDQLSNVFAALADPTRRAILARLADGEATVNELAEPFTMSLQAISKHLKVLEETGVVTRVIQGRTHQLSLDTYALSEAADWMDRQRALWGRLFDVVEDRKSEV
ncbi:MAG TPA: transcriptional regulator, partial [Micromonosporaceae bacterium]|nr:transcriptional regulator [Micromonosporaceae bacterium]